jgi:hypothetical protein
VLALAAGYYTVQRAMTGGTIASIMSYVWEKRMSKHPELFGTGAIEGEPRIDCHRTVRFSDTPTSD